MKHLQCLVEEREALEKVLKLDQSKSLSNITELMSNVNVLAQNLKVREYFICSPGKKIHGGEGHFRVV